VGPVTHVRCWHTQAAETKEVNRAMESIAREVGQMVREVLQDWPRTIRATILLTVAAAAWISYHVLTK
jgi:hypothetical protein